MWAGIRVKARARARARVYGNVNLYYKFRDKLNGLYDQPHHENVS